MIVHTIPADDSACRAYRLTYPGEAATAEGVQVVAHPRQVPCTALEGELPLRLDVGDADVVVAHRPAFPAILAELERLQAEGRAIVVDVDDDLTCPHPDHGWGKGERAPVIAETQMRACTMADLVTCTTPPLVGRYASHGRFALLPNCVPLAMCQMPRESDGKTLGWAGLASGHPGDLWAPQGAVGTALPYAGWRFKVVGPASTVRAELSIGQEIDATGGLSLENYQTMVGTLDVGIVPLGDTQFNRAKSGLKGLEYAARGVPFVASGLPEYQRLEGAGLGLTADGHDEWFRALRSLMWDENLRVTMAEIGRAQVRARHTYEVNAELWCEAWELAMANRKGRLAA